MDDVGSGGTGEDDSSRDASGRATMTAATQGGRRGWAVIAAARQRREVRRDGSPQGGQMRLSGEAQEAGPQERGPWRTRCSHDHAEVPPERRNLRARCWTTCASPEARRTLASAPRGTRQAERHTGRATASARRGLCWCGAAQGAGGSFFPHRVLPAAGALALATEMYPLFILPVTPAR